MISYLCTCMYIKKLVKKICKSKKVEGETDYVRNTCVYELS